MFKEFKDFIAKGNVLDLAVAVVMGGAFGAIINSLVNDMIMPIVSLATKGISFTNLFVPLDGKTYATIEAAKEAGGAVLAYGSLIQALINFIIIAFVLFIIVSQAKKLKKEAPAAPPAGPTAEEKLLGEIRDLLKKQSAR
jgi:large conductance mechanosensitive channel